MARPLRIALIVLAVVGVVWLLFTVVFPAVEGYFNDPTLGAAVAAPVGGYAARVTR